MRGARLCRFRGSLDCVESRPEPIELLPVQHRKRQGEQYQRQFKQQVKACARDGSDPERKQQHCAEEGGRQRGKPKRQKVEERSPQRSS